MERYGLGLEALDGKPGELEARLLREALPAATVEALAGLRRELAERYERLGRDVAAIDPTLQRTVPSARNAAPAGTPEIEKKLLASLKRGHQTPVRRVARPRAAADPHGRP